MKRVSDESQYAKGRFGLDQNLILLAALCAFGCAIAFGAVNDRSVGERFQKMRDTVPTQSPETVAELKALAALPDQDVDLTGTYGYRIDYGSGHILQGDVLINDGTIRRRFAVNHYTMFGQASYTIVGSTIQYSDIEGDRYLFAETGTAIGADDHYGIFLEFDNDFKLFIETSYTEEAYTPLVKSSPTFTQKLRHANIWIVLQLMSLVAGVAILAYVVARLIVNQKSSDKPQKTFSA